MISLKIEDKKKVIIFIIIVILIEGAGFISGFSVISSNQEVYNNLIKPPFAPPAWLFSTVWTVLYFIMAVLLYRTWLRKKLGNNVKKGIIYFFIQLALNLIWTTIFFKFKLYGLAFLELMLLIIFILLTTFEFYKYDKVSAYLMIPYILWVSFAGVLSYFIWALNEM